MGRSQRTDPRLVRPGAPLTNAPPRPIDSSSGGPVDRALKYVLLTAARNEEAVIRVTLDSVIAQTRRPERWLIVDDGSTDRTAAISEEYAARHRWIEVVRRPPRTHRSFAGKAHAI